VLERVDEFGGTKCLHFQGDALISKQKRNNKSITFINHLNTEEQQSPITPAYLYKLQYSGVINTPHLTEAL